VLLVSHLGRPKGQAVPAMSLAPAATRLSALLGQPVGMAPDCIARPRRRPRPPSPRARFFMLENCRFHAGDEKNDEAMSRRWRRSATSFVNDAFGAATGRTRPPWG